MWLYFKVCKVSVRRASEAKQGMIVEKRRVVFCGGKECGSLVRIRSGNVQ